MSVIIRDNGTGTAGTSIAGQTASPTDTTSATWTVSGGFQYKSGGGFLFTFNQANVALIDTQQGNVTASASCSTAGDADVDAVGVCIRGSDTSNFWMFWMRADSTCDLYMVQANVFHLIGSTSFSPGSGFHTLSFVGNGTAITGSIDGTAELNTTSTFNQTATLCGMFGEWNSSVSPAPSFAWFEADNITVNQTVVYAFPLEWKGAATLAATLPTETQFAVMAAASIPLETLAAPPPFPIEDYSCIIIAAPADPFSLNDCQSTLIN